MLDQQRSDSYLVFDRISKCYDKKTFAVENFSYEAAQNEFIVIIGPSGCGKSTLLRMVAGLEGISSGELLLDGRSMNELKPQERDLGMVFQDYALYPHMTVAQNLSFNLKIAGISQADREARVKKLAALLGLSKLLDRKPSQLSGGQKQRVALGRALIKEPKLLLMDEPLSNLDTQLRMEMRVELARLHKELKTTVLYVTHDQVEAMTLADTIIVMKDGKIQQIGTPQEIYKRPSNSFVARFLGSVPINFVRYKELECMGASHLVERPQVEDSRLYGLRPEDISLCEGVKYTLVLCEHYGSEQVGYFVKSQSGRDFGFSKEQHQAGEVSQIQDGIDKGDLSYDEVIRIKLPADSEVYLGQSYDLTLKEEKVPLIFDKESGKRLNETVAAVAY